MKGQNRDWSMSGNGNLQTGDFIGSSNSWPLTIKTNNQTRMYFDAGGSIGIGLTSPQYSLHLGAGKQIAVADLGGTGTRLVFADSNGVFHGMNMRSGGDPACSPIIDAWTNDPNDVNRVQLCPSYNNVRLGISGGYAFPTGYLRLDVLGNARVSQSLFTNVLKSEPGSNLGIGSEAITLTAYTGGISAQAMTGNISLEATQGSFQFTSGSSDFNLTTGNTQRITVDGNGLMKINPDISLGRIETGKMQVNPKQGYSDAASLIVDADDHQGDPHNNCAILARTSFINPGINMKAIVDNGQTKALVVFNTTVTNQNNPDGSEMFVVHGDGHIQCNAVKVRTSPWPDYVFDKSYDLMPLKEVEAFIGTTHHLPGVPSADEIEKEGHDLGATDAVLLRKIEELTLYVIELQKEVEALKAQGK